MAEPKIDDSRWPLVLVDWVGDVTLEEIDAHFEKMAMLTRRGRRFAVLVDMRGIEHQTAAHRQRGAEKLKSLAREAREAVVCTAHVVSSSIERGVLTAVYWLSAPPFETKVFTDRGAAQAWLSEKLQADALKRAG